jgi:hypothetical protein
MSIIYVDVITGESCVNKYTKVSAPEPTLCAAANARQLACQVSAEIASSKSMLASVPGVCSPSQWNAKSS